MRSVLTVLAILFSTAGCVAMRDDVTNAEKGARAGDDAIRADLTKASEGQKNAYLAWLADHPGDVEGATRAAFGAHAAVTAQTNATASKVPQPTGPTSSLMDLLAPVIASVAGATGIGAYITKKKDDAPFVGSRGQTVSEAAIVDFVTKPS